MKVKDLRAILDKNIEDAWDDETEVLIYPRVYPILYKVKISPFIAKQVNNKWRIDKEGEVVLVFIDTD